MRIIMFGTGPFAVPTFQALVKSQHEVPLLVTRPVSNSGKRRKSSDNPTRDAGMEMEIEIFDPVNVNESSAIEKLKEYDADLFVVCDYGQILSNDCLAASRFGGINLHGSLLPRYRGAAPIQWAIFHGDKTLGVTVIHMSSKLDAGNCITTATLELGAEETAENVEPRLAQLGVQPVLDAIEQIGNWDGESPLGTVQDKSKATKAPRLQKKDGLIDWTRSAPSIQNQVLAFQPWPGSYTNWTPVDKAPLRLIIHQVAIVDQQSEVDAGCVASCDPKQLVIQTGAGCLSILRIQPAGKKPMPIADFLRGYQPQPGDRLS